MLPLWLVLLLPLVQSKLSEPEMERGSFSPSKSWILSKLLDNENLTRAAPTVTRRHSESYPPCTCGCGQPPSLPSATITPIPTTLTLSCQTPLPYEHISWWLFKCPSHGQYKNVVQISSGPITYLNGYEVITDYNEKGFFSSLVIKDISSEETSGLYQCVSHAIAPSSSSPFFSRTDYFVIGKRTTMKDCFYDALSREDFKREIKEKTEYINYRQPRIDLNSHNTIVFDFSDAIAHPNVMENDLKPPLAQNLSDIPIQNNTFVRFDFTGGDIIQNRENDSKIHSPNNTHN